MANKNPLTFKSTPLYTFTLLILLTLTTILNARPDSFKKKNETIAKKIMNSEGQNT